MKLILLLAAILLTAGPLMADGTIEATKRTYPCVDGTSLTVALVTKGSFGTADFSSRLTVAPGDTAMTVAKNPNGLSAIKFYPDSSGWITVDGKHFFILVYSVIADGIDDYTGSVFAFTRQTFTSLKDGYGSSFSLAFNSNMDPEIVSTNLADGMPKPLEAAIIERAKVFGPTKK